MAILFLCAFLLAMPTLVTLAQDYNEAFEDINDFHPFSTDNLLKLRKRFSMGKPYGRVVIPIKLNRCQDECRDYRDCQIGWTCAAEAEADDCEKKVCRDIRKFRFAIKG